MLMRFTHQHQKVYTHKIQLKGLKQLVLGLFFFLYLLLMVLCQEIVQPKRTDFSIN